MVKATIPFILITIRNIFMRLNGSVEEVMTMWLVYKIWQLLCSYSLLPPKTKTKKMLLFFYLELDFLSKFTN